MFTDSQKTSFHWKRADRRPQESMSDCIFWTSPDGRMCIQRFSPAVDARYQPHSHSEYNLVVCLEGEKVLTQLGQSHAIGPKGVIIGNYGVEYSSAYLDRNGKRCKAISISLDRRLMAFLTLGFDLPPVSGETCPAFIGNMVSSTIYDFARTIAEEMPGDRPGHKLLIEVLSLRLLVEALRIWPRTNIETVAADHFPRLPRKDFVRAYEFMRWCRKEDFRLQHLCQFLGSSEERFTRLFLASTRHTPANFYNRMLRTGPGFFERPEIIHQGNRLRSRFQNEQSFHCSLPPGIRRFAAGIPSASETNMLYYSFAESVVGGSRFAMREAGEQTFCFLEESSRSPSGEAP